MENILQKQIKNVMSQFPEALSPSSYSMPQEILSPEDIKITRELIRDSQTDPLMSQLLKKLLNSYESIIYENSVLASRIILEAGAKRVYQHNPQWIDNFAAAGGDFDSSYKKMVLLQRELLQTQLDKEGIRNEQLERTISQKEDEIQQLTKSNKSLFTENYDLLKYKYLHESLKADQSQYEKPNQNDHNSEITEEKESDHSEEANERSEEADELTEEENQTYSHKSQSEGEAEEQSEDQSFNKIREEDTYLQPEARNYMLYPPDDQLSVEKRYPQQQIEDSQLQEELHEEDHFEQNEDYDLQEELDNCEERKEKFNYEQEDQDQEKYDFKVTDPIKEMDLNVDQNNEDLYELLLSKQSVFDVSKETISLNQNSKLSSSIRSKNSLIMDAERSTKTLDILIKSTQQRHLKRNMTKNAIKEKPKVNEAVEIEESMDIGSYQIAGVNAVDNRISNSITKSSEDSPRKTPPTPEPVGKHKSIASQPTLSLPGSELDPQVSKIRGSYKVTNPEFKQEKKEEMILVHNEFKEDQEEEKKEPENRAVESSRNTFKYPFRKEGSKLMNTLDEVTKQAKMRVICNRKQANQTRKNKSQGRMKPTKSVDLAPHNKDSNIDKSSAISRNSKSSASYSRLRQPTPTSVSSRKSLESIRTNLMTSHYRTMRNAVKSGLKTPRGAIQKENHKGLSSHCPPGNPKECTTPTVSAKRPVLGQKSFQPKRFRF
ncbi:unnamed protein product [Moneuplotes crassus]|uniref:Uncharacterized protein n=1 Tax=Euplotes crassus TaxID=5936 RepID=A0AAD1YAD2_EUPCR|nr:unnamed protein product [Moneuplotes crassus]